MAVALAMLGHVAPALAYGTGFVESVCTSMTPLHDGPAQGGASPYSVAVSNTTSVDNTPITVTLKGVEAFTGFMLEARDVNETILDGFSVQDAGAQIRSCSPTGVAITHTGSDDKSTVSVTWTPTATSPDNVFFRATFVKSRSVFWVGLPSLMVTRQGRPILPVPSLVPEKPLNVGNLSQSPDSTGCGLTKTCMRLPAGCSPSSASCFFVSMTPMPASEQVAVEMSGPDTGYLAFAFSGDTWMGDDDIYQCTILGDILVIGTSHSSGRDFPPSYPNPVLLASMSNASARKADGTLQCAFTLSQVAAEPRKANLKNPYHLFLAHGETDEGEIEKHDVQPMVSVYRITPLGAPVEVATTRSNNIVKAHGSLMLVSWLSLCSVGVVLARFFKPVWPDTKLLGEKVWFQLHRGLMVLAVLTTITAFVIPFCYRLGWSGRAHSVLGCIVMFLALMQPIMAFFRPHPNTPMRPLFNWAHWFVGTAARILAAACLFLGVDMESLDLPDRWDKLLLMGALLWQLAAEALLEILGCCGADKKSGESFEMSQVVPGLLQGKLQHNHNSKLHPVKSAVLGVYVAGNVAFLIALLVGVGTV